MKTRLNEYARKNQLRAPFFLWRDSWPQFHRQCSMSGNSSFCKHTTLYMGANSFGACDFYISKPCVYFTQMREPIARIRSHYSYFCIHGREERSHWKPGWTRCEMSLTQWASRYRLQVIQDLSWNQYDFIWRRMHKTCNCTAASCQDSAAEQALLNVAKANIRSGAIVPLLLEDASASMALLESRTNMSLLDTAHFNTNMGDKEHLSTLTADATVHELMGLEIKLYKYAQEYIKHAARRGKLGLEPG
jgi:hypothetical protein